MIHTVFYKKLYTTDIGSDRGDNKRRYLAYYILCLVYDKVISNLDLKLSDKFYKRFHPEYTVKNPNQKETKTSEQEVRMFKLVYRAIVSSRIHQCIYILNHHGFIYSMYQPRVDVHLIGYTLFTLH